MTRIIDRRRKSQIENEADELRDKYELMRTANAIAQQEDMEKRFGEYDKDVSVGNMYQRKKKGNSRAHMKSYCPDGVKWVPTPEKLTRDQMIHIALLKGNSLRNLAEFLKYEKMQRDGAKNIPNRMMNEYVDRKNKKKVVRMRVPTPAYKNRPLTFEEIGSFKSKENTNIELKKFLEAHKKYIDRKKKSKKTKANRKTKGCGCK